MHTSRFFTASIAFFAASSLICAADKDISAAPRYIHPKTKQFTDFRFRSPLPAAFVSAYPKRKEMGDQYLEILGVIAIVGETKNQRADMRRIAHVLMGLIDNDRDGLPDDARLWNKWKKRSMTRIVWCFM